MFKLIIVSLLISFIPESIGVPVDDKLLAPKPELQTEIKEVNDDGEINSKINPDTIRASNSGLRTAAAGGPFLSDFPSTWVAAKDYCKVRGFELLSIETQSINSNAIFILENAGIPAVWTSGTDAKRDGSYEWTSGKNRPFVYTDWIDILTPLSPSKNCVFLGTKSYFVNEGKNGWYVKDCSDSLHFICE